MVDMPYNQTKQNSFVWFTASQGNILHKDYYN